MWGSEFGVQCLGSFGFWGLWVFGTGQCIKWRTAAATAVGGVREHFATMPWVLLGMLFLTSGRPQIAVGCGH